jgi:hypothetical protein
MAAITGNPPPQTRGLASVITFDADATIPPPNIGPILSKRKFAPRMTRGEYKSLVDTQRKAQIEQLTREPPARALDGFLLLECCRVEFPDEAQRAEVQEMELTATTPDDLKFFTNLAYVDAGDNKLSLNGFGVLPALEELHLHCNMITKIGLLKGFESLEVLDLSYNKVGKDGFRSLMKLPRLRVLDLTCNSLNSLPNMMTDCRTLEVLSLERNRLEREETLLSLSSCPNLRELNLAHNFFRAVPSSVIQAGTRQGVGGFRMLEWLNLAHNYISNEEDIVSLVDCPRLSQVILYGNPLTSPGNYAAVDAEGGGLPSRSKRSSGGATASAVASIQAAALSSRAGSSRISTPLPLQMLEKAADDGRVLNFITEPPQDRKRAPVRGAYSSFKMTTIKDAVMPSNAQWKEAGNRALFDQDYMERMDAEEQQLEEPGSREDTEENSIAERSAAHLKEPTGLFMTEADLGNDDGQEEEEAPMEDVLEGMDELLMPGGLFQESMVIQDAGGGGDPAALRTALSNLRYALKHPLVADDKLDKPAHYAQHTPASLSHVKPRIPYHGRPGARNRKPKSPGELARKDRAGPRGGGLAATNPALANIEYVLDRMNSRVAEVENDLGLAQEGDETMANLINMVNGVMRSYESTGEQANIE